MNAVALNSLFFNVARLLGPALGGALLGWLGAWPCFLVNGLSYLAVLAALAWIDVSGAAIRITCSSARCGRASALARRPALLFLVLTSGTTALCGWPFMTLLPAWPRTARRRGAGLQPDAQCHRRGRPRPR